MNRIVALWDDKYCVEAAFTNSTTKQRRVVELAQAEDLLDFRSVPFDPAETWSRIAEVHDPRVRRGREERSSA